MDLQHLSISRAVLFDIPTDRPDKTPGVPSGGQALVSLGVAAKTMVTKRIAGALGKNANGMEISIIDSAAASFFQTACEALDGNDQVFMNKCQNLAVMLARAQNNKHLAHSKLMVIQGAVTAGQLPYLVTVKAELQDGLSDRPATNAQHTVQYFKDLFMTDSQRLFKIGFLQRKVANPSLTNGSYAAGEHLVHLFDHLMTSTETRNAAFYFYSGFMGCNIATSARARTRDFFENTRKFIEASGLPVDSKLDLNEALRAELKSNSNVINVVDFASAHMTGPVKAAYEAFMFNEKQFPNHSVAKDTEYVSSKLKRRRKIIFTNGVSLSSPPDVMSSIQVKANDDGSTTVVVPAAVESRE